MAAKEANKTGKKFCLVDISSDFAAELYSLEIEYGSVTSRLQDDDEIEEKFESSEAEFIKEEEEDQSTSAVVVTKKQSKKKSVETKGAEKRKEVGDIRATAPVASTDSDTTDDLRPEFNCKCNCRRKFDPSYIKSQKTYNTAMTKTQLDLVLMGKISNMINLSETLGPSHNHKEVRRAKSRCIFRYHSEFVSLFSKSNCINWNKTCFSSITHINLRVVMRNVRELGSFHPCVC